MRVAVVGSRDFSDQALVRAFIRGLSKDSVVVSGGARGVDSVAVDEARARGLAVIEHEADWSQGRGAGLARNGTIVADADVVVAFYDGSSRGTLDTIKKAAASRKRVYVIRAGEPLPEL